jgi:hypothetical protein
MKNFPIFLFFILTQIFPFDNAAAQKNGEGVKKIVIIRHGEKPDKGENLSCEGLNRALKLVTVLHQKIGTPDYIFVPTVNTGKSTHTARMYQTIIPFAVKYNLEINTKYEVKDAESLVLSIKEKNGTILLVWEHKAIENILQQLGIKNPPHWGDNDFDSMFIITFQHGKPVLTKDKENITPANACP